MKRKKIIISLIFIVLTSTVGFAQRDSDIHEFQLISSEIFSLIKSLNENIDSYFHNEKKEKLRRYLGYFQNDLQKYLEIRKKLMDDLTSNNFNTLNDDTKKIISDLKTRLGELSERLSQISVMLNDEQSSHAKYIVQSIHESQASQRELFLTELEKLINGQNVDKTNLTMNGKRIYYELSESVELISEIRDKLK